MEIEATERRSLLAEEQARRAILEEASRKALAHKVAGFHCSESVFLAVNETFKITDPCMVKAVTGFHGGGGTHRLKAGIELTPLLADIAAGTLKPDPEDMPVEQVQHLCGAMAAGIVCVSLLYGRCSPEDDLTCVDELSYELHRRFQEEYIMAYVSAVNSWLEEKPVANILSKCSCKYLNDEIYEKIFEKVNASLGSQDPAKTWLAACLLKTLKSNQRWHDTHEVIDDFPETASWLMNKI